MAFTNNTQRKNITYSSFFRFDKEELAAHNAINPLGPSSVISRLQIGAPSINIQCTESRIQMIHTASCVADPPPLSTLGMDWVPTSEILDEVPLSAGLPAKSYPIPFL